jgi:hypothetical protein
VLPLSRSCGAGGAAIAGEGGGSELQQEELC